MLRQECVKLHPVKKLKLSHYTPRRRLGERRYSSYSFSTSALDGGEWLASRPGRPFAPGKGPPVPVVQEAGWAPETTRKILCLCQGSNLDRPVVQPVARHYTDWATRRIHPVKKAALKVCTDVHRDNCVLVLALNFMIFFIGVVGISHLPASVYTHLVAIRMKYVLKSRLGLKPVQWWNYLIHVPPRYLLPFGLGVLFISFCYPYIILLRTHLTYFYLIFSNSLLISYL
jgi:hypothetical protein